MGALGTHIKSYVVMNHISRRDRNKEKKKKQITINVRKEVQIVQKGICQKLWIKHWGEIGFVLESNNFTIKTISSKLYIVLIQIEVH